jgi:hypothetical protein
MRGNFEVMLLFSVIKELKDGLTLIGRYLSVQFILCAYYHELRVKGETRRPVFCRVYP